MRAGQSATQAGSSQPWHWPAASAAFSGVIGSSSLTAGRR